MERKKIVITGMGAVTPIGVGVERYWDSLVQGVSGIDTIQKLDVEALPIKVAGEVKDFRAKDYMSPKLANGMEDFMQYAYVSAEEALAASGLEADPYRTGIVMSTALRAWPPLSGPSASCPRKAPGWGQADDPDSGEHRGGSVRHLPPDPGPQPHRQHRLCLGQRRHRHRCHPAPCRGGGRHGGHGRRVRRQRPAAPEPGPGPGPHQQPGPGHRLPSL